MVSRARVEELLSKRYKPGEYVGIRSTDSVVGYLINMDKMGGRNIHMARPTRRRNDVDFGYDYLRSKSSDKNERGGQRPAGTRNEYGGQGNVRYGNWTESDSVGGRRLEHSQIVAKNASWL